jgi:hypothetical protein
VADRTSPGGVGDGLPSLPDGEPLLQRWFVIPMLVLVVVGIGVSVWMFSTLLTKEEITVAERRPPGTAEVTHERGRAVLNDTTETEPGPDCAERLELFGDAGGRGTVRAAMQATCSLLATGDFPAAQRGLANLVEAGGQLRVAIFELTGVESSSRVEPIADSDAQRIAVELNPRFQFEEGFRAAPMIIHELTHLAGTWPGEPVTAEQELEAMQAQHDACEAITFGSEPPRGCLDAELLVDDPGAIEQLVDAGYGRGQ